MSFGLSMFIWFLLFEINPIKNSQSKSSRKDEDMWFDMSKPNAHGIGQGHGKQGKDSLNDKVAFFFF